MKVRIEFINGQYFVDVCVGRTARGSIWKNAWVTRSRDEAYDVQARIVMNGY